MKTKLTMAFALIVLIGSFFWGCTQSPITRTTDEILPSATPTNAPDSNAEPDISGEILDISTDGVLRVLVDSISENIKGQIWVSINEDTKFIDANGKSVYQANAQGQFKVGNKASFLSNGIIMESYPMQTSALYVYLD